MKKEYNTLEIDILRLGLLNVTNAEIPSSVNDILDGKDDGEYDLDA